MHELLVYLVAHGWHVWAQWRWYFADHTRGGFVQWYASKSGTVLRCYYDKHDHFTQYCNPIR